MTKHFSSAVRNQCKHPISDQLLLAAGNFVDGLVIEVQGSGRVWRSFEDRALEECQSTGRSAYVAAASVVAFADGVGGQQKEDLLNSTLLAQLAANKKHDREKDAINWYRFYRSVLQHLGWSRTDGGPADQVRPHVGPPTGPSFGSQNLPIRLGRPAGPRDSVPPVPGFRPELPALPFIPVRVNRPRFSAGAEILARLGRNTQVEAYDATTVALERLRNLGDRDRRVIIFESSCRSSVSGNFQIIAVHRTHDGNLRMTLAGCFFVTNEVVSRVLSYNFSTSNTQMFQSQDTMTLSDEEYGAVRERVIQQLGDQASVYIDEIDLV